MSDLLERLKKVESSVPLGPGDTRQTTNWFRNPDGPEAAAELARLTAENERLLEALQTLINSCCSVPDTLMDAVVGPTYVLYGIHLNKARAALETPNDR